jgi:hypothetical protein
MKLTDEVKVIFKNSQEDEKEIIITVDELLENTKDDLLEMLENTVSCTSSSCYNESQNFCDCGGVFEDYYVYEIEQIIN